MSLKAFHVVFVTLTTLMAFGVAAWAFATVSRGEAGAGILALGIGSAVTGIALIVYGRYVLKKLKAIPYL